MKKIISALALALCLAAPAAMAKEVDPENMLLLDLKDGQVIIEMRPDLAPQHVARIKELVRKGFYDGLTFHRVISGFMAQGGDPDGTGTGGSGQNIPAEFTPTPFVRGTVGMARSASPNSGDSQFFIMFDEGSFLNGKYTVWGEVVDGMEHVDNIARGEPPTQPDKIVKLQVAADVVNKDEAKTEPAPAEEQPAAPPATDTPPAE